MLNSVLKRNWVRKKCSLLKALLQWSFQWKFFIAWRSFPQAENCPSQSILIPVSCQHLPVIKKWWSQLEWWTDCCLREPREQGKMLVEHVSMSAFSWLSNFIQVPVLSQHCVADAVNSAVWTVAGVVLDCFLIAAPTVPVSLIWNYLTHFTTTSSSSKFLLDSFLCYFGQGISSCP